MRMIEAVQQMRYAQVERAVGDKFEAEVGHARGLVAAGKAKYADDSGESAAPRRQGKASKKAA